MSQGIWNITTEHNRHPTLSERVSQRPDSSF